MRGQSRHTGRAAGYFWSTGEKRRLSLPKSSLPAPGSACGCGSGSSSWGRLADHCLSCLGTVGAPGPSVSPGGTRGWHELGHTGMSWLQYLAGSDGGILKAGTGPLSQGLGGSGKGKVPAGHKSVGNICERQRDMQGHHPVLVPDPRWGWDRPLPGPVAHPTVGCRRPRRGPQETPLPLPAGAPRPALPGSLPSCPGTVPGPGPGRLQCGAGWLLGLPA